MEWINRLRHRHRRTHQRLGGIKVSMSELNDLINKLCPDGVPYKKLNEVLNYEQPSKYLVSSKNYSDEYSTPVLTAGKTFILGYTDEVNGIYQASKDNPVIIFDDFTTDFKWVDFPFKAKSSGMKMLTPIDSNTCCFRYIYYAMSVIDFVPSDHKRHWISQYSNFTIPLPPLPVQSEIVRILDAFTELEAELEAELADRIEQYEYYRGLLLSQKNLERMDGGKVEHDTVDSLVDVITATAKIKKNEYKEIGLFPVIDQGMNTVIAGYTDNANALPDNEWILFGDHTCSLKYFDGRFVQGADGLKILKAHDNVLPKFVFYALKNLNVSSNEYARHWTSFKKNELPVPSLATQERIVDILDRFDTLTTSLTDGIPAEIAMRREQYEYCRSRILDFPRLPDDAVSDDE